MHVSAIVAAIKVNGRVLRESGDTVTLPFGAEYAIYLKNLNSVRAEVKVSVDGTDATDGTALIIDPNSSIELERFIKNGNLKTGNKFKFIERTGAVEDHRGIGAEDGLIRVEAWREALTQTVTTSHYHMHYYNPWYTYPNNWPYHDSSLLRSCSLTSGMVVSQSNTSSSYQSAAGIESAGQTFNCMSVNDSGITVPGSQSNQVFQSVYGFPLESTSTVVVLRLKGTVAGARVSQPITVKAKPRCSSCGLQNKATNRFCSRCGTGLVIL